MEKLMEFFNKAHASPIKLPQNELIQKKREYVPDEAEKEHKKINNSKSESQQSSKSPLTDFKKLNEELDAIELQKKEFIENQLPVRRYQRLINQYQSIKTELGSLVNKHEGLLKIVGELTPNKEDKLPRSDPGPKPSTTDSNTQNELQRAKSQLAKLIKENLELKENLEALSGISKQQQQKLNIYERISNFKIKALGFNHFEFLMYSENKKWKVEMDIKIEEDKTTAVVIDSNSTSEDLVAGSEFTFNSSDNYNFFVMLFIQLNSDLIKFK